MSDIFDQIHAEATAAPSQGGGDIFDQIHAESQSQMQGFFKNLDANNLTQQIPQPGQPTPQPPVDLNRTDQASQNPVVNAAMAGAATLERPYKAFERGIAVLGGPAAQMVGLPHLAPQNQLVQQGLNPQTSYPHNPTNASGMIGSGLANAGMMMAGPVGQVAQATGAGEEKAEQGANVNNVLLTGALNFALSKLAPGGRVNGAILARTPILRNALVDAAKNVLISAGTGVTEAEAVNLVNNELDRQTGLDPNRPLMAGAGSAAIQGAITGGGGQALHEAIQGAKGLPLNEPVLPSTPQPLAPVTREDALAAPRGRMGIQGNIEQAPPQRVGPTGQVTQPSVEAVKPLGAPAQGPTVTPTGQTEGVAPVEQAGPQTPAWAKGRPLPPAEVMAGTNADIVKWAADNGYDTSRMQGLGRKPLMSMLDTQRLEQEAPPSARTAAQSGVPQRQLPDDTAGWDAGRMQQFANRYGYDIDQQRLAYDQNKGMAPREAIQKQIEEQYAQQKGVGPSGTVENPVETARQATLVKPPEDSRQIPLTDTYNLRGEGSEEPSQAHKPYPVVEQPPKPALQGKVTGEETPPPPPPHPRLPGETEPEYQTRLALTDQALAQKDVEDRMVEGEPAPPLSKEPLVNEIENNLGKEEPAAHQTASEQALSKQQELVNLRGQLQRGELAGEQKTTAEGKVDSLAADVQQHIEQHSARFGEDAGEALFDKVSGVEEKKGISPEFAARRARQGGAVALPTQADLTGPGSIVKEEIKPAVQAGARAVGRAVEAIRQTLPRETFSGGAETEANVREKLAQADNDHQAAMATMEGEKRKWNALPVEDQHDFQRAMYNGEPQANPKNQPLADQMHKITNERRQEIEGLGVEAAKTWQDHWWNMMWKRGDQDNPPAGLLSGPGKIEGKAGTLKARSLSDFDEAAQKGLVPKYSNPVEMFEATDAEQRRFIAGYKAIKDMATDSRIKREPGAIPDGWREVDKRTSQLYGNILPGKGGKIIAPEGDARLIENMTKPSAFSGSVTMDAARSVNNTLTQGLLGLSGNHIRKVGQELFATNLGNGIDNLIHGRPIEGLKDAAGAFVKPVEAMFRGGKVQRQMLGLEHISPEDQPAIDLMTRSMRAKPDSAYETNFTSKMLKAWDQGGVQGMMRAGAYAPASALEQFSKKVIFNYVQRAKLSTGFDQIKEGLANLGPNATNLEKLQMAGRVSDHIDNIFGLMVRDNLFWNRTARDIGNLSMLSVGWNYGSLREIMGAGLDTAKLAKNVATGKGFGGLDTRRISYVAAATATQATIAAAMTYLATGKGPKELKDYAFPQTGNKNQDGTPERLNLGFYTSDWYEFAKHPGDALLNKASPLARVAGGLMTGKDSQGVRITNPDDNLYDKAKDIGKYLSKAGIPISIQQLGRAEESGTEEPAAVKYGKALTGVRAAPVEYSRSDAENKFHELQVEHYEVGGRTQEEANRNRLVSRFVAGLRNGNDSTPEEIGKALDDEKISPADLKNIKARSGAPEGIAGKILHTQVPPEDLMKVYRAGTPSEQEDIRPILAKKIAHSQTLRPEEKEAFIEELEK